MLKGKVRILAVRKKEIRSSTSRKQEEQKSFSEFCGLRRLQPTLLEEFVYQLTKGWITIKILIIAQYNRKMDNTENR